MTDRQPTYPGRVKLTPVDGQANTFDMVMADEPTNPGTAPIKKNLLQDDTVAKIWPDETERPIEPTVNDALAKLARFSVANVNIIETDWISDTTYTGYAYRAAIAISEVDTTFTAEVIFNINEAQSGNYAPITNTYDGGVYIYSAVTTAITIPLIICEVVR